MMEFWVHAQAEGQSEWFWLGSVFGKTLAGAKRAALKKWPHWKGQMYAQQAGSKFHPAKECLT